MCRKKDLFFPCFIWHGGKGNPRNIKPIWIGLRKQVPDTSWGFLGYAFILSFFRCVKVLLSHSVLSPVNPMFIVWDTVLLTKEENVNTEKVHWLDPFKLRELLYDLLRLLISISWACISVACIIYSFIKLLLSQRTNQLNNELYDYYCYIYYEICLKESILFRT